jgi:hypothetical protein
MVDNTKESIWIDIIGLFMVFLVILSLAQSIFFPSKYNCSLNGVWNPANYCDTLCNENGHILNVTVIQTKEDWKEYKCICTNQTIQTKYACL